MAKTKQTARKVDQPVRQQGMEPAVVAPPAPQEDEGDQAGAEEVEVQPGEQVPAEQNPAEPTGEQVTTEENPVDPTDQPGTSTAPAPDTSASTGAASEVLIYMNRCEGFAKTWFEEVVEKQEQAYRDLIASLVSLVEEKSKERDLKLGIVGFTDQEVQNVLGSISDTSGKYIDTVDWNQVEVEKEEEQIERKEASVQQKALDEYYDTAKDLCHSQAVYMARLEKLSKVLNDSDKLLAIVKHVQLPAVQVTVTTRERDRKQAGLSGKEMVILEHLPDAENWAVGRPAGERMMAAWLYFVLHKQVTGSTVGQDKCAEKFGCSTTQFKRMVTGKWQENGKRKDDTKSVSRETKKRRSDRLKELAQQERSGKKAKKARKAKVIHLTEEGDYEEDDD